MDQRFRQAQKNYEKNTSDPSIASDYIRILEQLLGVRPVEKIKVKLSDPTLPCIICEKQLDQVEHSPGICSDWVQVYQPGPRVTDPFDGDSGINSSDAPRSFMTGPHQGVSVSSAGNYGSQVLDGDVIYFLICDECIIKNSHKMFYRERDSLVSERRDKIKNAHDYYKEWRDSWHATLPDLNNLAATPLSYFKESDFDERDPSDTT